MLSLRASAGATTTRLDLKHGTVHGARVETPNGDSAASGGAMQPIAEGKDLMSPQAASAGGSEVRHGQANPGRRQPGGTAGTPVTSPASPTPRKVTRQVTPTLPNSEMSTIARVRLSL